MHIHDECIGESAYLKLSDAVILMITLSLVDRDARISGLNELDNLVICSGIGGSVDLGWGTPPAFAGKF